jgi:hypothetical protein
MSPKESELFEKRMAQTGIKNKSAFIRKMCIDGHVVDLDVPTFNEINRLLRINSNNINQLARRVNSGGEAPREDILELIEPNKEITLKFGEVLTTLLDIADIKPGKRFIPPLTFRDLREYSEQSAESEG